MKNKKKKAKHSESRPDRRWSDFIRNHWKQKGPVLLFFLVFAVLMVLFYALWLSSFFEKNIHPHIVSVNARISSFIMNLFGMGTYTTGESIFSDRFSVSIAKGCDAIEAMALFSAALLAFPAGWKYKVIGLFSGIAILFLLNIVRVISLFLTGTYFQELFEVMHVEVWQVLFILIAIGLWISWIRLTRKEESNVQA